MPYYRLSLHTLLFSIFFSISIVLTAGMPATVLARQEPTVVVSEPGGYSEQVLTVFNKFMDKNSRVITEAKRLNPDQLGKAVALMSDLYVTADKSARLPDKPQGGRFLDSIRMR